MHNTAFLSPREPVAGSPDDVPRGRRSQEPKAFMLFSIIGDRNLVYTLLSTRNRAKKDKKLSSYYMEGHLARHNAASKLL